MMPQVWAAALAALAAGAAASRSPVVAAAADAGDWGADSLLQGRSVTNVSALPMSTFVEGVQQAHAVAPHNATPAGGPESLTDTYRLSVVRIHSIATPMNWFAPFQRAADTGAIGSGFASELEGKPFPDPVFVTNAHVVRDAHTVRVQLPAAGQADFEAYVPLIYEDMDLALVRLADPAAFAEFLAAQGAALKVLPIKELPMAMGLEVAAVGFPLGSSSLKLSRGVIAGTEQIDGRMVFQSTAPISPGSSGGPLFALPHGADAEQAGKDATVVGANFAAASDSMAQNANYVVPAVHIRQLLNEFWLQAASANASAAPAVASPRVPPPPAEEELGGSGTSGLDTPEPEALENGTEELANASGAGGSAAPAAVRLAAGDAPPPPPRPRPQRGGAAAPGRPHGSLRCAPVGAVIVEANDMLYNMSGGCTQGVYVSKIDGKSVLRAADPPVPEDAFITAVDGVALDSFGMGRSEGFLGDPVPFETFMYLKERVEDPVSLTVCHRGQQSTHTASMVWSDDRYSSGIKEVTEPFFHPEDTDFEYFADVAVMQMTVNHVVELLKRGRPATLGRWILPENMNEPRVIVAYVKPGTYASRIIAPGMVVGTLNGANISTLKEFRRHYQPSASAWTLETERGVVLQVDYHQAMDEQLAQVQAGPQFAFLRTEGFVAAVRSRGAAQQGARGASPQAVDLRDLLRHAYEMGVHAGIAVADHIAAGNNVKVAAGNASMLSLGDNATAAATTAADAAAADATAAGAASAAAAGLRHLRGASAAAAPWRSAAGALL